MVPAFHARHYPLRFLPNLSFGTQRYPEKIARRLRALNIAVWIAGAIAGVFGVARLLDLLPGERIVAFVHLSAALAFALIPLLHRFSPLAAPIAFILLTYVYLVWIISVIGTAAGSYLYFLTAAALSLLFVGIENIMIAGVIGVSAIALVIGVHLIFPADTGFAAPWTLFYVNFISNVVASSVILFVIVFYAVRQIARAEETAEREFARSEALLENILPSPVAARLKAGKEGVIADRYDEASILFADMAGFTSRAGDLDPDELVRFLNRTFTMLDALVERHGLEKIKTTGDSYMVVSGVPDPREDHAAAIASLALDMQETLASLVDPRGRAVPVRIGLASGPVVAGVVGTRKFFYDVWGDPVNLASRMESTGDPGKIQVTNEMRALLEPHFAFTERGMIEVKGKGALRTWFLVGRKA
jgi:adenylate cyclase